MASFKGFRERLNKGETIICAAGCVSELARRGLIQMDDLTPEAALEYPLKVRQLLEDFVHCGTDIVVACNHHGIGPPADCSAGNWSYTREYLKITRGVADKTHTLMAGSINPTGHYDSTDNHSLQLAEDTLTAHIKMAVEEGADMLLCDSFTHLEEAKLVWKCTQLHGKGLPVVLTLSTCPQHKTGDEVPLPEALRALEDLGVDVVGLGCGSGPSVTLSVLREARKICRGPLAGLTNAYRAVVEDVTSRCPSNARHDLHAVPCTRADIQEFSQGCRELDIELVGLCCGGNPSYIREIAEVYNRQTPSSKFAPDISKCCKNISKPTPTQAKRRLFQMTQEYRSMHG